MRLGRRPHVEDLAVVTSVNTSQPAPGETAPAELDDRRWPPDPPAGRDQQSTQVPDDVGGNGELVEPPRDTIDLRNNEEQVGLSLVMWLMRRRVHLSRLPPHRTVLLFEFTGACKASYWMVLDGGRVALFVSDPRLAVDVVMTADAATFQRVFMGRMSLADALSDNLVGLHGPDALVQSLPRWFEWSRPINALSDHPGA